MSNNMTPAANQADSHPLLDRTAIETATKEVERIVKELMSPDLATEILDDVTNDNDTRRLAFALHGLVLAGERGEYGFGPNFESPAAPVDPDTAAEPSGPSAVWRGEAVGYKRYRTQLEDPILILAGYGPTPSPVR